MTNTSPTAPSAANAEPEELLDGDELPDDDPPQIDELLDDDDDDDDDDERETGTGWEHTGATGRGPLLVPRVVGTRPDGSSVVVTSYESARILIPAGYVLKDGALSPKPLSPDSAPEPDTLWRQTPISVPDCDQPVHREASLEVWHGTPEQPTALIRFCEVRDLAKFRDPSQWRARLGPVSFTIHRRASWRDPRRKARGKAAPAELLGRWGPLDPVPFTLGAAAPAVVLLSIAGGLVRLAETGQSRDGMPIYSITPEQLSTLLPRLSGMDHAATARARREAR